MSVTAYGETLNRPHFSDQPEFCEGFLGMDSRRKFQFGVIENYTGNQLLEAGIQLTMMKVVVVVAHMFYDQMVVECPTKAQQQAYKG